MSEYNFIPHPLLKGPTSEETLSLLNPEGDDVEERRKIYLDWCRAHNDRVRKSEDDPFEHGFRLPQWATAERYLLDDRYQVVLISGGNGSSKTESSAYFVVNAAVKNPNSVIYCFAQDMTVGSIQIQQKAVYKYLPIEYKQGALPKGAYVKYSVKNGFTGQSLILKNGSRIFFSTYSQFISNRSKFEGIEVGSRTPTWSNLGFWFDEYLEGGDLFETMMYRLPRRNAKMLLSFTPIDGMTPFVASLLKDTKVEARRKTSKLAFPGADEPKEVDSVRVNDSRRVAIVFFGTEENPWGGFENLCSLHSHKSVGERLTRFYGIPVKSMTTLFPNFNTQVHVFSEIPKDIGDSKVWTTYMVVDPAGSRNYFALWLAVNNIGEIRIIREWPDLKTHGEWAEFGDPKWKYGPASKKYGYNVSGYVELFNEIEEELGIEPYMRIGDSRFFANENSDNKDLFSQFDEHGMFFVAADGRNEDAGIAALDDWFQYNPDTEVDSANRPMCMIHEDCENTIYSLIHYTNDGKRSEALRDPIDCLRYIRLCNGGEGPEFVDTNFKITQNIGGY